MLRDKRITIPNTGTAAGALALLITGMLSLAVPAGGADLACPRMTPPVRSLSVTGAQPLRRGKSWRAGKPQTVFSTLCDERGMKTEESEYSHDSLVRKERFVWKSIAEARRICAARKSEAKLATSFSEENRGPLDEFCRENKKKDFDAVFVFDMAPGSDPDKPVRRIFRLFNGSGLTAEEHEFGELADLETRTVYEYGPGNALLSRTDHAPDGSQLRKEVYSSDKASGYRSVSFFDANNQLKRRTSSGYGPDGTLLKETDSSYETGEREIGRTETSYSAKGDGGRELVYRGDLARPLEEYRFRRKLDGYGNWTEEIRTKAAIYEGKRITDPGTAPRITRREIGYFPAPSGQSR
ncbi:MAG TPA: hypothetical protein PL037_02100 [Elusimicrobiales bacterium]|nr:hypothetical protein [Elusimicrobiales bacterium]